MSSHLFTYVVGDIYGDHAVLTTLLDRIHEHADGEDYRLVFVGNTIDHGANGGAVLYALRAMELRAPDRVVVLRGWHEQLMAEASKDDASFAAWMRHGGQATLRSFGATRLSEVPREVLDWVARRPPEWHDELRRYVGDPELALAASEPAVAALHLVHGGSAGHDRGDFSRPRETHGATDIDTGAGLGGYLTAAIFTNHQAEPLGFFQAAEHGPVRFLKSSLKPATVRDFRLTMRTVDGVPETASEWTIRQDADEVAAHLAAKQRRMRHRKAWAAAAGLVVAVGGSALLMRPAMDLVARSIAPADDASFAIASGPVEAADPKRSDRLPQASTEPGGVASANREADASTASGGAGGTTVIARSEAPGPASPEPAALAASDASGRPSQEAHAVPAPAVQAPAAPAPLPADVAQVDAAARPAAEPGVRLHALPTPSAAPAPALPPSSEAPSPAPPPALATDAAQPSQPAIAEPAQPQMAMTQPAVTEERVAELPPPVAEPEIPPPVAGTTPEAPVVVAEAAPSAQGAPQVTEAPPAAAPAMEQAATVVPEAPPAALADSSPADPAPAPVAVTDSAPAVPPEAAPALSTTVAEAASPIDTAVTGATAAQATSPDTSEEKPVVAADPQPQADAPAVVAALPAPPVAPEAPVQAEAVAEPALNTSFALSLQPSQIAGWGVVGPAAVVPGLVPGLARFASTEMPPLPSTTLAPPASPPLFAPVAKPKPKPKPVARPAPVHGVTHARQAATPARPAPVPAPVQGATTGEPIDLRALIDHPIGTPRARPPKPRVRTQAELPSSLLPLRPPPRAP